MQHVADFFWNPKKKKYGVHVISKMIELPVSYHETQQEARQRAHEHRKLLSKLFRLLRKR